MPTYQGMISISVGIMMVDRIATNMISRPGNRYLANTNPVSAEKNATLRVAITEMRIVFRYQRGSRLALSICS